VHRGPKKLELIRAGKGCRRLKRGWSAHFFTVTIILDVEAIKIDIF
jgi:hypothetical protein